MTGQTAAYTRTAMEGIIATEKKTPVRKKISPAFFTYLVDDFVIYKSSTSSFGTSTVNTE